MTIHNRIITFLKTHHRDMFALLEKMVRIQSGTYNKQGVDQMVRLIKSEFQSNSVTFKVVVQDRFGNHIVVRSLCEIQFDKQIIL